MWKYTVETKGMMCGMCEAHVNEAIRKAFSVKKVTSSHKKSQTFIVTENEIDETVLRNTITGLGYEMGNVLKEPYHKKGFFGLG